MLSGLLAVQGFAHKKNYSRDACIYDLPCRRAPFLLKKVLPGQMGGPDVLKVIRNKCKENLIYMSSFTVTIFY